MMTPLQQAQQQRALLLAALGSAEGEQVLQTLERRFEIHLPVFQGRAGSYDPLDAMRRDAHREVFLVIRRQLELARQEANPNQHNDQDDI